MPKKPTPPKSRPFAPSLTLLLLVVAWALFGCATPPAPLPPLPVKPVQIPPLPQYARQPSAPPECLPTCTSRLNSLRESWLQRLTTVGSPDGPAKESTTGRETN